MSRSKALQLPDATLLRSFIRKRTDNQAEADDVLQDVYETYLEATDLGLAIESVGAWLTTVAKNKILDRFRKKKSEQNYEDAQDYEEQFSAGRTKDPSVETLRKLAEAIDVHIATFFSTNDVFVFDLIRLRRKYNDVNKLTPHLYMGLGKVVQFARDIKFF